MHNSCCINNYEGNNIVISIGTLGKASNRSGMKYKVNIDGIVNTIASKSIQMIDQIKINPEELAGLEWSLDDLQEPDNKVLIPKQSHIYEDANGMQSLRFVNFKREDPTHSDNETETEYNFMNIEYDTEPIYNTENEDNEIILGFDKFEQEDNDFSIIDYLEEGCLSCHEGIKGIYVVGLRGRKGV